MATTIAVSEATHRSLVQMKAFSPHKTMDELVRELIRVYKRAVWAESSALLRERMKERGLTLRDLVGPRVELDDLE